MKPVSGPSIPTGLMAAGNGIALDWADNTEANLAGYNVYRATSSGGTYTKLNASLSYNGYGYFDSDEFCDWVGELGTRKRSGVYGAARRALASAPDAAAELALKAARNYGGASHRPAARAEAEELSHQHFGTFIVSCDSADLRPLPRGVMIYDEAGAHLDALPPPIVPRVEVIDAVERAITTGIPPRHDGRSARATLEVCAAMLESARTGRDVALQQQVALPTPAK